MKKQDVFKACLILSLCAVGSVAYGANAYITSTTSIGSLGFTPSNKVQINVDSATTGYTSEALHAVGSRVFGTDSKASIIYWKDVTIGTAPTSSFSTVTAPTATGAAGTPDYSATTGWTSM